MGLLDLVKIVTARLTPVPATAGASDVHITGGPSGRLDKTLTGSFDYSNIDSLVGREIFLAHDDSSFSGILEKWEYPGYCSFYFIDTWGEFLPKDKHGARTSFRPEDIVNLRFESDDIFIGLKDS